MASFQLQLELHHVNDHVRHFGIAEDKNQRISIGLFEYVLTLEQGTFKIFRVQDFYEQDGVEYFEGQEFKILRAWDTSMIELVQLLEPKDDIKVSSIITRIKCCYVDLVQLKTNKQLKKEVATNVRKKEYVVEFPDSEDEQDSDEFDEDLTDADYEEDIYFFYGKCRVDGETKMAIDPIFLDKYYLLEEPITFDNEFVQYWLNHKYKTIGEVEFYAVWNNYPLTTLTNETFQTFKSDVDYFRENSQNVHNLFKRWLDS